tara:strand:+ start:95 stop:286 length:192 start_codon:yes stop_codon:yes gene_type:complete
MALLVVEAIRLLAALLSKSPDTSTSYLSMQDIIELPFHTSQLRKNLKHITITATYREHEYLLE